MSSHTSWFVKSYAHLSLMVRPAWIVHAVADGCLVLPAQPAAPVSAWGLGVLQAETGEDGQTCSASVLDDLTYLVGALLAGDLHHPHDAPVNVALPDFLGLPDDSTDLAVVKIHVAVSESKDE